MVYLNILYQTPNLLYHTNLQFHRDIFSQFNYVMMSITWTYAARVKVYAMNISYKLHTLITELDPKITCNCIPRRVTSSVRSRAAWSFQPRVSLTTLLCILLMILRNKHVKFRYFNVLSRMQQRTRQEISPRSATDD